MRFFNLAHWSIRQKAAIAPAIAIAVLCTLAFLGWSVLDQQRSQMSTSYKDLVAHRDGALRLPHTLGQIRTDLYKLSIWSQYGVPDAERDATVASIRTNLQQITNSAAELKKHQSIDGLKESLERYQQGVATALTSIQRSPIVGFSATRRVEHAYQQAIDDAEAVAALAEANFDNRIDGMADAFNDLLRHYGLVALIAGVSMIVLALRSANMIARPVRELACVVDELGHGDLGAAVPWTSRRDEIGLVARAIESFKKSLLRNRELEHEREQTNQRLEHKVVVRTRELDEQAAKLAEALDKERELNGLQRQFVSMVSHEFRTPLAIIDGSAQRILRRLNQMPTERVENGLNKIRTAVARLTDLMESVLSAARLEAGSIKYQPEPCKLDGLIEDLCRNYEEIDGNHKIIVDIDCLPSRLHVDVSLMRQVFSNLISNALKYSPEATRVWVVCEIADNGNVQVSIRDEGHGIPPDELDKLFDRYFRASTSTGIMGTGIGLHLVKMLVEMHGGTVKVASKIGEGTSFTVDLPFSMVEQPALIDEVSPALP